MRKARRGGRGKPREEKKEGNTHHHNYLCLFAEQYGRQNASAYNRHNSGLDLQELLLLVVK